jgi:glycogen debranching enzyme
MPEEFSLLSNACRAALRNAYTLHGYVMAGTKRFRDLWTRDFCYASLGMLRIGDVERVNYNFNLLLKHQARNGRLPNLLTQAPNNPFGIMLSIPPWDVRGKNKFPLAPYYTIYPDWEVLDSTMLFIIYYTKFLKRTGLKAYKYAKIKKAVEWVESRDRNCNGLLEEEPFAGCEDTLIKTKRKIRLHNYFLPRKKDFKKDALGNSAYHNVLAVRTYESILELAKKKKEGKTAKHYSLASKELKRKVREMFWNDEGYFNDFLGDGGDNLHAAANLLAIRYDYVSRKKSKQILENIEKFGMNKPLPLKTRNKPLASWRINPVNRMIGSSDYQNTAYWLWLGALYIMALKAVGWKNRALEEIEKIEKVVKRWGVREVYNERGEPLKSRFSIYKAEENFTWSAGMLLEAL